MAEIWTYQDALEHLADMVEATPGDHLMGRRARAAILTCYRDLPYRAPWTWFNRTVILSTVAPQTDGTAAYTAATRTVTLSGSTWPSDVTDYILLIDGVQCRVASRTSSTVIVLAEATAPAADIASGTTYSLFKALYVLPEEWRNIQHIRELTSGYSLAVSLPVEAHDGSTYVFDTPGTPVTVTVLPRQNGLGQVGLTFTPPPDAVRRYSIKVDAQPRALQLRQFSTAATVTSGQSSVTISSDDVLPERLVGCVARFSTDQNPPTGNYGSNPYAIQRRIIERTSDTAFVVDVAIDDTLSSAGLLISDPIDIEPGAMLTAFQRAIEYEFALLCSFEGLNRRKELMDMALDNAIGNDVRSFRGESSRSRFDPVRHASIGEPS